MLGMVDIDGNTISVIDGGPDGETHALEMTPGILDCGQYRYKIITSSSDRKTAQRIQRFKFLLKKSRVREHNQLLFSNMQ